MARYIKAVECAEIISEKLNIPLGDLVDIFAEIPTADVVPKSEVEELSGKYEDLKLKYADLQKDKDELIAWGDDKKTEVAREIFEEIEKAIEKCKYNQSTPFGIEERYNPYAIIKQVDKLKKKYTETDNGTTNSNM